MFGIMMVLRMDYCGIAQHRDSRPVHRVRAIRPGSTVQSEFKVSFNFQTYLNRRRGAENKVRNLARKGFGGLKEEKRHEGE